MNESKWIAFKDQLPVAGDRVILADDQTGFRCVQGGWAGNQCACTHWQPWPDPPSPPTLDPFERWLGACCVRREGIHIHLLSDEVNPIHQMVVTSIARKIFTAGLEAGKKAK